MNQLPKRLASIDVFRSLTMFLMIFFLDSFQLSDIPSWLGHAESYQDSLGAADIIFPIFLFIVGLSLHFAINNRIKKGETVADLLEYIFMRAGALIVMGFFFMNLENYNTSGSAFLSQSLWRLFITLSFFLIWLNYPDKTSRFFKYFSISIGIILLAIMGYLYPNIGGLKSEWWGILGMIGWGYLICALIYLLVKDNFIGIVGAFILLLGINICWNADIINFYIPILGNCAPQVLVMAGVLISSIYKRLSGQGKDRVFWVTLTALAVCTIAAAFIIRPYTGGISKMRATTSWVFLAIGAGIIVFEILIYLIDIKGKQHWFKIIRPAGTSTLTCYLMTFIYYSVLDLLNFNFPEFLSSGMPGLVRSAFVALFIIFLVKQLERKNITLKI